MAIIGNISTINVNGNELTIKDAALTEIVNEIIDAIGANNTNIAERINDLHNRSFDNTIKISSQNESEIASIQDGLYKIQYVTVTGEGDNATETLNNSAILIQNGTNQYLYKDGQLSSRTKTDSTWETWITFEGGVTSVNGQTGAVTLTIPDAVTESTVAGWGFTKNTGTLTTETQLSKGTAIGTGNAVTDINVSNHQITLVKGATYATQSDIDTSIANLVDSAPATLDTLNELATALGNDENFATTVATQIGEKYTKPSTGIPASDLADGVIPDVPVQSVNGQTGAVTLSLGQTNVIETVKVNGAALTPDANKVVDVSVPTNISDLVNDSGYITASSLVQSDWNQTDTTANDYIKNKPNIIIDNSYLEIYAPKLPGSSYNPHIEFGIDNGIHFYDIFGLNDYSYILPSNIKMPYIFKSGDDLILYDVYQNGPNKDTSYININCNNGFKYINSYLNPNVNFTVNNVGAYLNTKKLVTEDEIPTKTSELTNDSGFLTSAPVTSVNSKTGAVTVKENVQSDWNATTGDAVILNKPTIPEAVTESTVAGWGFTKNTGTLTSETQLSKGTATGTGNAVTDINVSNHQITLVKGATYATQEDINESISNLVNSAPATLDTLNELATALGNDPNFATTVATQIGEKYTKPSTGIPASDLAAGVIPTVPVQSVNGQTGAVTINVGVTSFNGSTGAVTYTAPVTSVNGATGAVTVKANVQSDWNATTGDAVILNKPTIPTVNDSTVTITMNGNTVGTFTLNKSGNTTIDLGTVLTSHQSIKTVNNESLVGTGNVTISGLPTVTSADNGKVLMVVDGAWQLVSPVSLYSGSSAPSNSQGNNGDIYVQS